VAVVEVVVAEEAVEEEMEEVEEVVGHALVMMLELEQVVATVTLGLVMINMEVIYLLGIVKVIQLMVEVHAVIQLILVMTV
jgi:hypothetical protein